MKKRFVLPGMAAAVLLFASTASATPADERWDGWIGCWRAEGAPAAEVLCIVPQGEGVRMITLSAGKVVSESRVFADGEPRPVSEGGCEGTESAQWSSDGFRLFTRADLTCGSNVRRGVSSIIAMLTPKEWVNAQSIGAGDLAYSRTVRYTATDLTGVPEDIVALATQKALSRETVRHASTEPLDLSDVREAVRMVDYRAVEALVLARNEPFDINARTLVALDAQGVPASLIDALVAVSHPEEFAVVAEPEERAWAGSEDARDARSRMYTARLCSSWGNAYDPWLDPFAAMDLAQLCYGSYLGSSRYGSRYGWGRYGLGYGYTPIIVVRNPQPGQDPVTPPQRGSVSRDGYRSGTSSSGSARSRNDGPPRSSSVGTTSGSSTSGTTGTTTGTTTTGSSGGDTGRTAKPRGSGD